MNYQKIYVSLIDKRRNYKPEGYVENHHIIPKSEGGIDEDWNIVALTAREHYIAHLLLAKIYNDYKMWYAWNMMFCKSPSHSDNRDFKFNSRLYERFKILFREKISEHNKLHPTKPMLGKRHSEESKRKMSNAKIGKKLNVPEYDILRRSEQMTIMNKNKDISGEKNPMFGHSCTEYMTEDAISKWKSNIGKSVSRRQTGIKHSVQRILANSLAHKNKKLWNDGECYKHSEICPGPGWIRGRIKKKKKPEK